MSIQTQTAYEAFDSVLDKVGATLPKRDVLDSRIVREVIEGNATYEGKSYKQKHQVADTSIICGMIDSQQEVGGWPELKSKLAPKDRDHDGMPDDWEETHGLDKNNPEDRNFTSSDGYTFLEQYLNGLH